MKKTLFILGIIFLFSSNAFSQFTFYLIDNFEGGNPHSTSKWWRFGDLKMEKVKNTPQDGEDLIAKSCGENSLSLSGGTRDWYIGGIGTSIGVDASRFSRFQIDVYGDKLKPGKVKIELFEDDNLNYQIEQDPQNDYMPIYDDKWVAEVNILGEGFTRVSIPFSAFRDVNPGVGDDVWNPGQEKGSGGLLTLQLVAITQEKMGKLDFKIDNLLLTY